MNFDKPTTGHSRTAGREAPVGASLGGDRPRRNLIHGSGGEQAGRDRRPRTPNLPHVGEMWRHVRTGREGVIVDRVGDQVITSISSFWEPVDLFLRHWERAQ